MKTFKRSNNQLRKTMRTHLIDDLSAFGVWDNDYETFTKKRGKRIIDELNERLHPEL